MPVGKAVGRAERVTGVENRVKHLYTLLISSCREGVLDAGIHQFLQAGCDFFSMPHALLLRRLSQQIAEVTAAIDEDDRESRFFVGQHLTISNTPVERAFEKNETCTYIKSIDACAEVNGFAYNGVEINSYIGTVMASENAEPMVLCFFSAAAGGPAFTVEDTNILELLAEGVACMVDLQKTQAQRKMTDQAMLALGSVKTLEEYLQQASLPDAYGVPARVVEVLQKRIGHAPLDIGHVAEDLNLSKRTLQRRLQQQEISFAELRDQVRYHHSIDYLIKQHLSIDSISASLDFSDRTSFTNAFKRWTGLSPSTFRKLFRDYA